MKIKKLIKALKERLLSFIPRKAPLQFITPSAPNKTTAKKELIIPEAMTEGKPSPYDYTFLASLQSDLYATRISRIEHRNEGMSEYTLSPTAKEEALTPIEKELRKGTSPEEIKRRFNEINAKYMPPADYLADKEEAVTESVPPLVPEGKNNNRFYNLSDANEVERAKKNINKSVSWASGLFYMFSENERKELFGTDAYAFRDNKKLLKATIANALEGQKDALSKKQILTLAKEEILRTR